jgi:hypothetical protein
MSADPRQVAAEAVDLMLREGMKKHVAERWRAEDMRMHILKAQRHLSTFLLVLDGHSKPDGENHLRNGICRAAMALTIFEDKK